MSRRPAAIVALLGVSAYVGIFAATELAGSTEAALEVAREFARTPAPSVDHSG